MTDDIVHSIDKFETPFAKQIELQDVILDNNVRLLRVRIKEGHRFTIMDLDPVTARHWGDQMISWADSHHKKTDD